MGSMALNLTPCVYPLIPITNAYFGARDDRPQLIGNGLSPIGVLAVTNSILGGRRPDRWSHGGHGRME
ncbi:MAG: hypothetical protein QNJ22_16780 [Desulfosarcinaceae bacterium]|nr:hypothetical protein [Desulfosarcinaceae bacterium]